ncbi:MAG: Crp/Fnr family transcriptional regulator [Betaproteobacteria bacterium]
MTLATDVRSNRLLASLADSDETAWLRQLEPVELRAGDVLHEPGRTVNYLYFPTSAIISLLYITEQGQSSEIAIVGDEGVVGISLFLGGHSTPLRAIVQSAGVGLRLRAHVLMDEFEQAGAVMQVLLRYTQALMTQTTQTAVCNRHHPLEQQLCRWLLLNLDRLHSNHIDMTHETISNLLGVRREGVTQAAGRLNKCGLIESSRGRITVVDRVGLEERACECYSVVRNEYDRLLPRMRSMTDHARTIVTRTMRRQRVTPCLATHVPEMIAG